ncbi:hypothetical protein ACFX1Q_013881 [Malus domestica]
MATTEARLEAKPEPKEIEENFATAVAWDSGKPLVMERVKVAPPKAMEMRVKVKDTSVYHTKLYFCRRFVNYE